MYDQTQKGISRTIMIAGLLLFAVLRNCGGAEAASLRGDISEGNRHYKEGDFPASQERFSAALKKAPESDIVNFNLGAALYQDRDYEQAIDHFQKVLLSEDELLKEKAYYNLGNALYQSGLTYEREDVSRSISSLENALSQYERALEIDLEDDDTEHNYGYVKGELQRLKIKQQQQQQQQGQKQSSEESEGQDQQASQSQEQEGQQQQQAQAAQEQQQEDVGQEQAQGAKDSDPQDEGDESQQARVQDAQELTQEEAKMLLKSYQQAEEPQGLLNVQKRTRNPRPVDRDW